MTRQAVAQILQNKDVVMEAANSGRVCQVAVPLKYPQIDEIVLTWFRTITAKGMSVSG